MNYEREQWWKEYEAWRAAIEAWHAIAVSNRPFAFRQEAEMRALGVWDEEMAARARGQKTLVNEDD